MISLQRFAQEQRWSWKQIQYSSSSLGGCKEASALVGGDGAFGMLKFERWGDKLLLCH